MPRRCAPLSSDKTWDAIIADYHLPGFDAPAALAVLHESGLDLPFLVVSGAMGEDLAVAMMKAGAHDYLNKDSLARLAPAVRREIREAQVRQERRQAEEKLRLALIAAEEANHRYHLVADQGRTIIWEMDAEGLYTYVSHVSEAVFGYLPEELIGKKHFYDLHAEEGREAFRSAVFERPGTEAAVPGISRRRCAPRTGERFGCRAMASRFSTMAASWRDIAAPARTSPTASGRRRRFGSARSGID